MHYLYALVVAILLFQTGRMYGQHYLEPHTDTVGLWQGHARHYGMYTHNFEGPSYYGSAISLNLSYFRKLKNWEFGLGVTSVSPFGPSNKDAAAPMNGRKTKWENELFFQGNGSLRLRDAYLRKNLPFGFLSYGVQDFAKTPLLNESDGRSHGYRFKGLQSVWNTGSHTRLHLHWIDRVSLRGRADWMSIHQLFPSTDRHSKGIGILGMETKTPRFDVTFWNIHIDKTLNTSWFELHYQWKKIEFGFIYTYQIPMRAQTSLPWINQYAHPDENGQVASFKLTWSEKNVELGAAYTRAMDTGRFLFPKELGRDQFFTSFARNRLEGLADVNIFAIKAKYRFNSDNFFIGVAAANLQGSSQEKLKNKYQIDDYHQINTRVQYKLDELWEGVEIALLCIWKENRNNRGLDSAFNQSNYSQINLITNIYF